MPLLAVGDVPYADLSKRGTPSRAAGIFDARTMPQLEPLPASRTEVEMALNLAGPGAVGLLGQDATEGRFNLHVTAHSGRNTHHLLEATFKAFGRALDTASQRDPRRKGVPSSKGRIG